MTPERLRELVMFMDDEAWESERLFRDDGNAVHRRWHERQTGVADALREYAGKIERGEVLTGEERDRLTKAEARARELEAERDRLARALERLSEFESLAHDAAFDTELHAGSLRQILGEISAAIEDARKGGG